MPNAVPQPSDLELQILQQLWARGPMTARQVLDALDDGKARAYTSVLSTMQVMERKGQLDHRVEGKTHVYRAKVARDRVVGGALGRFVDRLFQGSRAAAVQALLDERSITADELAEIRRMLDARDAK